MKKTKPKEIRVSVVEINGECFGSLRFFERGDTIKIQFIAGKDPSEIVKQCEPFDLVIWQDREPVLKGRFILVAGKYSLEYIKAKEYTFRKA